MQNEMQVKDCGESECFFVMRKIEVPKVTSRENGQTSTG